ncbi:HAD-IIIC family phosphatase [Spongiactinospora sp. TRM90649]|uniref:HAD-IIIC family phosphatase n=1 Tax=Spongiactinospora sp. TRM90649 TaxID=3031114 RepID=UPI0023F74630|nr:HAD-IIIC family phosphatase [Spongiactinospora sp. TRM90649]MDF5753561.1 HAD-IIIC family phosphatase [Spongiactinospora sp. TRM90649]
MAKTVKCLVWDLDNTLWDGILLEGDDVRPFPEAVAALKELDGRGVLHSIASRNDPEAALAKLAEFGLADYFLYPQIGWHAKSASVKAIAADINIGLDTFAFVDDQPFERDEVAAALPQVRCYDAVEVGSLPDRPEFTPAFVTEDSRRRREMYRADERRKTVEAEFDGAQQDFLSGLGMRFTIKHAVRDDLRRAEELTLRTNQLNTTGYTYSLAELEGFLESDRHILLTAALEDRYGPYGTIGLALLEKDDTVWTMKLLLMSCRVMSRGVGTILINHIKRLARDAGALLYGEYVATGKNRQMLITYKFNRFAELTRRGELVILRADLADIPNDPCYVRVITDQGVPFHDADPCRTVGQRTPA